MTVDAPHDRPSTYPHRARPRSHVERLRYRRSRPGAPSGLFVVRACRGPGYARPSIPRLHAADSLRDWTSRAPLAGVCRARRADGLSARCCPEAVDALPPAYRATDTKPMWRMTVSAASFRPAAAETTSRRWTSHMPRRSRRCSRTRARAVKSRRSTGRRCLPTDRSAASGRARISWPSLAHIFSRLPSVSARSATSTRVAIAGAAGLPRAPPAPSSGTPLPPRYPPSC